MLTGKCFVDAVKKHNADFVSVAEADAMHFNTGNRCDVASF